MTLEIDGKRYRYYSIPGAARARGLPSVNRLPSSLKVLLEGLLRHGSEVRDADELFARIARGERGMEIPFWPTRVILQDVLGVPALVDIAGLRNAVADAGGDPAAIKIRLPVDIVVDHSLVAHHAGTPDAMALNTALEFSQNRERFEFIAWCEKSLGNVRVIPPGSGIVHQVNLESLASVVTVTGGDPLRVACPDTLLGTDSHTTMVNGLGVLGWGVGGIEAETAMLGRAISLRTPEVVGVHVTGALPEGLLATDLVLTITDLMRRHDVVGKFVEFFGPGLDALALPDRATIANMAPEFGAECVYFPIDQETIRYLTLTGRSPHHVRLVEAYSRAQGWWRTADTPSPIFDNVISLDLRRTVRSLAGPRRPEDRVQLAQAKDNFAHHLPTLRPAGSGAETQAEDTSDSLRDGDVVIAAITSCTNTSNPSAMVAAGLLAQKAAERGLTTKPWVKTTLTPGSKVVMEYLQRANLVAPLARLGFHVAGFGCATCIGMSGPLAAPVDAAIRARNLTCVAVLSGNRNFDGRIHPLVRASYLASPPLVVGYALAGTFNIDLTHEPLGSDPRGEPVYLRDIWPTNDEIASVSGAAVTADLFLRNNATMFHGDDRWRQLQTQATTLFSWRPESTYIRRPPYFDNLSRTAAAPQDLVELRPLAILGDSISTDHLSPSGTIPRDSAAGRYLLDQQVAVSNFNSYGTRRGNHEVAMRATLANTRIHNAMVPESEGSLTRLQPEGEVMSIFDAATAYRARGVSLIVVAGRNYGCGSSRDWAAKGVRMLGVRAVVAESFEHTHRSNLAGMGVLPLQLLGLRAADLQLDGSETFDVTGIDAALAPRAQLQLHVRRANGARQVVDIVARLDTHKEVEYYRHGGILQLVYRDVLEHRAMG